MAASIDIDSVFRKLGRPGRYHIIVYVLLCLNNVVVIFNHLAMAIYGAKTEYFCESEHELNMTQDVTRGPANVKEACPEGSNLTTEEYCPAGWTLQYRMEPRETNIISEFNLICGEFYLKNLATTIYFCGVMLGGLLFGSLSDLHGRKPFMLLALYGQIVVGVGIAFSHNLLMFTILRFIQGVFMQGLQTCSLVLIMELFPIEHRTAAGTVFEIFWGFGVCYLAFLAWAIRNWRYLQLALCLPSIVTIIYIWVIPESIRWLMNRKQYDQVEAILQKAAKFNGVSLGADPLGVRKESALERQISEVEKTTACQATSYSLLDMMRTPKLRRRSLVMFYTWFVMACGYYGLSLSITSLSGSKYLNLFFAGLFELPAYIIGPFIVNRFGRRLPLGVYLFIGGATCISAGIIPKQTAGGANIQWISLVLAIIGRFSFAGCFSLIFLYTSELFPTIIRNFSLGACSFWSRVGGVVAPQVLLLGQITVSYLPVIVFGSLSLLGAFLTILLPETKGSKLPDTISEAEEMAEDCDKEERGQPGVDVEQVNLPLMNGKTTDGNVSIGS